MADIRNDLKTLMEAKEPMNRYSKRYLKTD